MSAIGTIYVSSRVYIWVEPTVLNVLLIVFQRIKIRCYNIYRGYASVEP